MKHLLALCILTLSVLSCNSTKHAPHKKVSTSQNKKHANNRATLAGNIVNDAKSYIGVKYKWGGTTRTGMDCSGLIHQAFKANNISLPRVSRDMAKQGFRIPTKQVTQGDLLFFKVAKKSNTVNHVGLVVKNHANIITFIHATSSKGVISSTLNQSYWKSAFYEARRVL